MIEPLLEGAIRFLDGLLGGAFHFPVLLLGAKEIKSLIGGDWRKSKGGGL